MASRGREQLLGRLATFTPARWPGEPLSALECARRGWRLEAGPLLRCSACEAAVPARLPTAGRPRLRAECLARLRRLVSEGHRAGCRWSAAPLPAAQLRPPLPETPAGRRQLAAGLARLAAAAVPLPSAGPLPESRLEPERAAALLTEALGADSPHTDRAQVALNYTLAGWELTESEKYLQCSFGCRTWDTTGRPPPPEDALGGKKVLTASTDVIQDALDQCGLEELDFEMSVPVATEDEMSEQQSAVHTGSGASGDMERKGAVCEGENDEGKDVTESEEGEKELESKGSPESSPPGHPEAPQGEAAACSEEGAGDSDELNAGGDAGLELPVPADKISDAGSPARGESEAVSDGSGVADDAAHSPDDGGIPDPSSPAPDVGADTPASPEASHSSGPESPAEVGSVHSSQSAGDDPDHPLPARDDDGDDGAEPASEGDAPPSDSDEDDTATPPPPLNGDDGDGGSPAPDEPEQEGLTLSLDESEESGSSGSSNGSMEQGDCDRGTSTGSEVGDGSQPVSAGDDDDGGGSEGGSSAEESSEKDRSTDSLPATKETGATESPVLPADDIAMDTLAPSDVDPSTTSTDATNTTTAATADVATVAVEEQPRPAKRPADSPAGVGGVKRVRWRPAGPLEGHRCWCPWVAGVDGGEPGWRQAVTAISATGRLSADGGEGLWAGDAALDTMRRVWATLDQWTSPPAKSARA